jgi:YfiH family protein
MIEERIDLAAVEPESRGGVPLWRVAGGGAAGLFAGRGVPPRGAEELASILPAGHRPAWLRQVHGIDVLAARPGACGEGDALLVDSPGIAALVATADCLPVLVALPGVAIAIHAGWRGLASGVIGAALAARSDRRRAIAWIGPGIGPCCYEVGDEVATRVAAASGPAVVLRGAGGRARLDLAAAAAAQLSSLGVERVVRLDLCTRCHPDRLWSHRRDGEAAGRNLAALWCED